MTSLTFRFLICLGLFIFLGGYFCVCVREYSNFILLHVVIQFFFFGHEACGILIPQPGNEPRSSAVKA